MKSRTWPRNAENNSFTQNHQALDVALMSKLVQKVREALFFQMKVGTVERELEIGVGVSDQHQRFRLSRTKFRQQ